MATTQDEVIAEVQRANAALRQERDAALAQKAALAEVLDVINRSPSDPEPVFDAILEKAHRLCGAAIGAVHLYDGEHVRVVATRGFPDGYDAMLRRPFSPSSARGIAETNCRPSGIAGIPDRDQRRAEGDQSLLLRSTAGSRHAGRDCRQAL
jgi:hypothetical protein